MACQIILLLLSTWITREKAAKSDLQLGKGTHKGAVCVAVTYRHPRRGFSEYAAL